MDNDNLLFVGFDDPSENWSKLPHQFIESLPIISSESELKVILYILRHTWGYRDAEKKITLDEFCNGRKKRDGSRIDNGTGQSVNAIKDGLRRAIEHGFINQKKDESDKARIKSWYSLRLSKVDTLESEVDRLPSKVDTRSEKETPDRNLGNDRFGRIQSSLESIGIILTSGDTRMIDLWMEWHTDEWIDQALQTTADKQAGIKYAHTILFNWHTKGYPKPMGERKSTKSSQPQAPVDDGFMAELAAKKQRLEEEQRQREAVR